MQIDIHLCDTNDIVWENYFKNIISNVIILERK